MLAFNLAWRFALCSLAIWRAAHFLTRENCPWSWIVRLRARFAAGLLGRLLECFYCMSFLFALPLALFISTSPLEFLIQWLALSAVAALLERITYGPLKHNHVRPVSKSYLDKVIRGA